MTTKQSLRVLIIEDNPADVEIVHEFLKAEFELEFHQSDRLESGLTILEDEQIDVLLLDLSLPDSFGLDTFLTPFLKYPNLPIVVLTGNEDDKLAARISVTGSKGLIVKGNLSEQLLIQTVKTALEIHELQMGLSQLQSKEKYENEMDYLKRLMGDTQSREFQYSSIRNDSEEVFNSLRREYSELIKSYIVTQVDKYPESTWIDDMITFSYYLCTLNADTHDLLEIHREAVENNPEFEQHLKSESFIDQARNVLLQLFGFILSIYKNRNKY